jgi:hypothetical protein
MRLLTLLGSSVLVGTLSGCASSAKVSDLEERLASLQYQASQNEAVLRSVRGKTDRIRFEDSEDGTFIYVEPQQF